MKIRNMAATLLAITLGLGAFHATLAQPPAAVDCTVVPDHACTVHLLNVSLEIMDAKFTNPEKDQDRLMLKVCAADVKLSINKPFDAQGKLANIRTKVEDLRDARKAKINNDPDSTGLGGADKILSAVDAADQCITDNLTKFL